MKQAFTMLELLFVIILLGVLSIVAISRLSTDTSLQEATDQIIRHIRYTQHLAMNDDVYIPDTDFSEFSDLTTQTRHATTWFNSRWQIAFHVDTTGGLDATKRHYYYSIFQDIPWSGATDNYDGRVNIPASNESYSRIALDPQTKLYLTGNDWSGRVTDYTPEMNLKDTYNAYTDFSTVKTQLGLSWNSTPRLLFDKLGRPHYKEDDTATNGYTYLLTTTLQIPVLSDVTTDTTTICIEPYTGFTHQCD